MNESGAQGIGLATIDSNGQILDSWFGQLSLTDAGATPGTQTDADEALSEALGSDATGTTGDDPVRGVKVVAIKTLIGSLAQAPVDAHDVYLRLHLLSHCMVKPRELNLDGAFGLLTNVAWTSIGPCPIESLNEIRLRARAKGVNLSVRGVDKFPAMTDYVIPPGVRIADADRVRLGAHLAPGTTVMHEGFCNFNAGTLGASMVEGRISAGVIVGDQSDVGGSASIMGTLSGGGKQVISVGERCLLGANSGIGISLGDDCIVEAGCYVTAGARVTMPDGSVVKAGELSGHNNLLFRRDSQTGRLQALARSGEWGGLNPELHNKN